jgi:hypothetical protein
MVVTGPSRLRSLASRYTICAMPPVIAFEIIGDIADTEAIAVGHSIRDISRLRKLYGTGRWRKLKGQATVRLPDGIIRQAEIHWYEAHGIGKKEIKIKRILPE